MKNQMIDCKVGIFETEYTLICKKDHVLVKSPYIKWKNNNGSLAFLKIKIENPKTIKNIKTFFENNCLWSNNLGCIDDYLN